MGSPTHWLSWATQRLVYVILSAAVASIAVAGLMWSAEAWRDWNLGRLSRADVFDYQAISHVETDDDAQVLIMVTESTWLRDTDSIVWVDQLRCGGNDAIFSSAVTAESHRPARPFGAAEWVYTGAYPIDERWCFVRSSITATIDGRSWHQQIDSSRFQPGRRSK